MPARKKTLISVPIVVVLLLGFALPAAAATWTSEPVPAGPGALGPARLSFDAQGRALFLWNGVPTASQPRFTGMASRAPGGGWTRLANLPAVGWGNAAALQYATTRVLFVSGQVASVGAYNRAKLRLVAAYGRSDGSGLGSWQTLAPYETGFVAAANHSGHAIVLFDAGGRGLSTIERPSGGNVRQGDEGLRRPARSRRPSRSTRSGDRIVAWIRSGRIEARVRHAGQGWGSVLNVAKAPGVANTSLRAAVSPGGSFVLAWDAADIRESRPTRLIAGTAQRRPGAGLARLPAGERDAGHEQQCPRGRGGGPARDGQRRDRHRVDRRGARQRPRRGQGRPADQQRPAGRPSRLRRRGERRGRRRGGGTERPGGDRLVAGRPPEPDLHVRRAVARARASRSARPTCSRRRTRPASAGRPWRSSRFPGSRSRWSRSSRATAAASCPRCGCPRLSRGWGCAPLLTLSRFRGDASAWVRSAHPSRPRSERPRERLSRRGRRPPPVPGSARARAVHLQLRGLEHERDDQRHHGGPGHDRDRCAGDDHAVPADHGRADDPVQQADRSVGPQTLFHDRARAVRGRRAAERRGAGTRRADPRQLRLRRRRDRAADPARLHPHHAEVHGPHLARPGVRRHQRPRRHRSGGRAVDRRRDHDRDQLAGGVRVPGAGDRADRRAQPPDRRIRSPRTRSGRSTCSGRCCRRSACSSWCSASCRPTATSC